jgi:hypothetical protein
MADVIAPEYARFVAAARRAGRIEPAAGGLTAGQISQPVRVEAASLSQLLIAAAKRASGFLGPTRRTEIVWIDGDRQLAINLAELKGEVGDGHVRVRIPVRCDQTGRGVVDVVFAVGSKAQPSGVYASTYRRPDGPALVVAVWSEALVAFAWQCLLDVVSGIAAATGKDQGGNLLVPVDLVAMAGALEILPMARHRFSGASGLTGPVTTTPTTPPKTARTPRKTRVVKKATKKRRRRR